jgi:hypothetical protein
MIRPVNRRLKGSMPELSTVFCLLRKIKLGRAGEQNQTRCAQRRRASCSRTRTSSGKGKSLPSQ